MTAKPHPLPELVSFLESLPEPHILCDRSYRILAANAAYRATLSQLINKQHLPVKQHHTEGKVSLLVNQQLPMLSTYFQSLTNAWLRTAYGHQQLPLEDLQHLCGLYANHFEQRGAV